MDIVSSDSDSVPLAKRLCQNTSSSSNSSGSSSEGAIFPSDSDDAVFPSDDECSSPPLQLESSPDIEMEKIGQILTGECCHKYCVRQLCVNDVLLARGKFSVLNIMEQRQWLADKNLENSTRDNWETKYIIGGKEVCKVCFCQVYGFSPNG